MKHNSSNEKRSRAGKKERCSRFEVHFTREGEIDRAASRRSSRRWEQARRTRSREVVKQFGIELPKPKPERWIPRTVTIGPRRPGGKEVRLARAALFERVWAEPVWKLAKEWGLSDRGLAKACRRLQI